MIKEFSLALLCVHLHFAISAQPKFGEIQLCHSSSNQLKTMMFAGYTVNLHDGKIVSMKSSDSVFEYQELNKLIRINTLTGGIFSLKIVKEGIAYTDEDTSFTISTVRSVKLTGLDTGGHVYAVLDAGIKSISCVFEKNMIKHIYIPTIRKYIDIDLKQAENNLQWDFTVTENKIKSTLTLIYGNEHPFSLSISDVPHRVKAVLYHSKKDGELMEITAMEVDRNGDNRSNLSKTQKYFSRGVMKGKEGVFSSVICD